MKYWILFMYCCFSFLLACQEEEKNGFSTSATGVDYMFHEKGTGKKTRRGEVAMLQMQLHNQQGKRIAASDYDAGLYGHIINGKSLLGRQIDPILLNAQVGDSLTIRVKAAYLFSHTFIPKGIHKDDLLDCFIRIKDVLEFSAYQVWKDEADAEKAIQRKASNQQAILAYLEENGIQATKLQGGVYCAIRKQGKGIKPKNEDLVKLDYTVYNLNGAKIDASYDRNQAFQFVIGRKGVIDGLDIAVREMQKGAEATILIPSEMAYGAESKSKVLPAHSNLRFEMKLLEIER